MSKKTVKKTETIVKEEPKKVERYGLLKLAILKVEDIYPERNEVKVYLSDDTTEIVSKEMLEIKKQEAGK